MKILRSPAVWAAAYLYVVGGSAPVHAASPDTKAQNDTQTEYREVELTKRVAPSQWTVTVGGGTGVGIFQDIQVPTNSSEARRGDGKVGIEENADHVGFPLHVGLSISRQMGSLNLDLARLSALQMRASTGPSGTQSSAYSRLEAGLGLHYRLGLTRRWGLVLGADAALRRSSFKNVSSAHYIESAPLGGSLSLASKDLHFDVFGATAPFARFGYSEDVFLGGKPFKQSAASLVEFGVRAGFRLSEQVWLDTGLEQEIVSATIEDIDEYATFGLGVRDPNRPSRAYDLATTILRVGVRKSF